LSRKEFDLNKIERTFRWSAVLILLLTSAAKLASSNGEAPILDLPDPLFGLTNRTLLVAVSIVELSVAVALLSRADPRRKQLLLLWLSSSFLTYRLSYYWINPGKPCPCLGTLSEKLPLSTAALNALLLAVVIYLLVGSASALFWLLRTQTPKTGATRGDESACSRDETGPNVSREAVEAMESK
jgi:hypothetical protein